MHEDTALPDLAQCNGHAVGMFRTQLTYHSNEDCILLVNVIEGYAVRIIDQWIVAGWMVSS